MEHYNAETIEVVEMRMDFEKLMMNFRDLQRALNNR
jgi:hypothetical protein